MKKAFNKKKSYPDPNDIEDQRKGLTYFHKAIINGDVETVAWMLKNGADLLKQTGSKSATSLGVNRPMTALYLALEKENFEIFQMICKQALSQSPKVLSQVVNQAMAGSLGNAMPTIIFTAVSNNKPEFLNYLIDIGADLNVTNKEGKNILSWAASTGDVEILRLLIEKAHMSVNEENSFLLSSTISLGKAENIKFLISMGADIDSADKNGMTPLMYSLMYRVDDVPEFLLTKGAKIDGCSKDGTSLLHLISSAALMQRFLNDGGDKYLEQRDKRDHTPLLRAFYRDNTEAAKVLMARGADIHAVSDRDAVNALNYAVMHGNTELVGILLDESIDTSKTSGDFLLPVVEAARCNNGKMVSLLLDAGAGEHVDHIRDGMNLPLLFLSAVSGCTEFVKFLIEEKDFDVNAQDEMGRTALQMAAARGNFECVKFLLERGANAGLVDQNGATALHYLAADMKTKDDRKSTMDTIDCLIAHGLNPMVRRRDNQEMAKDRMAHGLGDSVQKHLERVTQEYISLRTVKNRSFPRP